MSAEVLTRWIAEEQEILNRVNAGPGPGVAKIAQLADKTGLEIMQAMLQGTLPIAHLADHLTFCAIEAHPGVAVFQGTPEHNHLNPMGSIHGGWIASVMDSALGSAVLTELPAGVSYATTELSVRYIKALSISVQRVRVWAEVVARKEKAAFTQARMFGPDGTVYAEAKAQCRIFAPRPK